MIIWLLLISVIVIAASGFPGLLLSRRNDVGQRIATVLNVAGSILGGAAIVLCCVHSDASRRIDVQWLLPVGTFSVAVDDLSLIFLIPIFLISSLGSVFGLSYWRQEKHPDNGRRLRVWWGLLTAGMAMVVLARDGVVFLMAWEVMALSAFFLVATEENKQEVREAAWVYLICAHVGTLCLIGFFALLRHATGNFDLWPAGLTNLPPRTEAALFILGVVGFGLKAGIMPLHVWLPGGHANAPSHVSAILSGVMLKTGVYSLVRLIGMMQYPPAWWGGTLLVVGTVSAVLGIAFAAGQRDFKRLLAYSSVENIGIIVMGIGLAALGKSMGRTDWVVLGLGGALLHVLNHSLFKPLLFMGSGVILHAAHTRKTDLLGGLAKLMPRTFVLFVIGTVAISGLPPLNGFVSELFLYIGLFRTVAVEPGQWSWIALAAPMLALVGALAVGCFVKLLGANFCGTPRSENAAHAHDPDAKMLGPMWVLAGCCLLVGVLPVLVIGILDRAIASWGGGNAESIGAYVPVGLLTMIALILVAMVAVGILGLSRMRADRPTRAAGTWDCGYARPTPRMQYTGSSFSQMMVDLLSWVLWPRQRVPQIKKVFSDRATFASDVPDMVLDRGLVPTFRFGEWILGWARAIQRGPVQVYLLYILGILLILFLVA